MLTKSPWAKEVSATFNGGGGGGYGNGGGGGGRRGGGGIGFPGGGIGLPGGGYPGGGRTGGGYPGGGYPGGGGGGYPGGGGGYPGGGSPGGNRGGGRETSRGTIRWESALPIQEALKIDPTDKPNPDLTKYYVLHLIGDFPAMGRRRNRDRSDTDDGGSERDEDAQNERRQEMFKDNTRLERKDGTIRVEKVEEGSRVGNLRPGTFFYFSRHDDLSMDDKQVEFVTKMGPLEIKAKFTFKEMVYHGKLAI